MVRAILAGTKTQTRRVAKRFNPPEFLAEAVHEIAPGEFIGWSGPNPPEPIFTRKVYKPGSGVICPYGKPGDRLWVRETWRWFDAMIESDQESVYSGYQYRADVEPSHDDGLTWKPSIHMPRAACRILLEVTDVRVERLQDISEDDARAEGVESFRPVPGDGEPADHYKNYQTGKFSIFNPKASFQSLWQSINGPESWEVNPWVWVVGFKRIEQ